MSISSRKILICLGAFLLQFMGCGSETKFRKAVRSHLHDTSSESLARNLDPQFRSFFIERSGPGETREEYIEGLKAWDACLNPDYTIRKMTANGNSVKVWINEENDFSKGINYPGWKATIDFKVSDAGLILEQLYKPDETNPDYRTWLEPALAWLKENRPLELPRVYDLEKKRLIKSKEAALLWVKLLGEWKRKQQVPRS